jgi:periplasmic protein CpxP/Spy
MNSWKKSVAALAAVATVAGGIGAATLASSAVLAQPSETTATAPGRHHGPRMMDPMRFLDGRIAFLKAVLKITPAQEADFNKLAAAMRANVAERISTWKDMRETHVKGPLTAVDRLARLVQMTQMRAQQEQRLLAAFKPLYQALSPEQQKTANHLADMMARHGMRGMRHGGHRGRW